MLWEPKRGTQHHLGAWGRFHKGNGVHVSYLLLFNKPPKAYWASGISVIYFAQNLQVLQSSLDRTACLCQMIWAGGAQLRERGLTFKIGHLHGWQVGTGWELGWCYGLLVLFILTGLLGFSLDKLTGFWEWAFQKNHVEVVSFLLLSLRSSHYRLYCSPKSCHFIANRWGNNDNSERLYLLGLQNHFRWWLEPCN